MTAAEAASVAWWRGEALAAMTEARAGGRLPILCGGTGLYFASLAQGLTDIPAIPAAAREEARRLLAESGPAALHALLAAGRTPPPRRGPHCAHCSCLPLCLPEVAARKKVGPYLRRMVEDV